MRSYVLFRILIMCTITFVNIRAWNFRKSSLELDLALQGELKGQNICDDKEFPVDKRKTVCKLATEAAKGKKPIFEKQVLRKGNENSYQCQEKFAFFIKTELAYRVRRMFLCETDTEVKYYFGTGKNHNEVAIYVEFKDMLPMSDEVEDKKGRKDRSSVEVDESGVPIQSGDESSAIKGKKREDWQSVEDDETAHDIQRNKPSTFVNEDSIREKPKNESTINVKENSAGIESEKELPKVVFHGVMEDIDLDTLYRIRAKVVRFFNKWF